MATYVLDANAGDVQKVTFTTATSVDYANFDQASLITLAVASSGSPTITWPPQTVWSGGSPPTLTGLDVLFFATPDGAKVHAGVLV
jgi:hypothetical protein